MISPANTQAASDYAARTLKLVPGLLDMQRMAGLLLAERSPPDGRVLVVGAGGGSELKAFATAHPGWRLEGIDPSAEMLILAKATLGPLISRIGLHQGYVDSAPDGPFDGASCLLTLHFTTLDERRQTLLHIRQRLKPGGALVVTHLSFGPNRSLWLSRYAAFAAASGVDPQKAKAAAAAIQERLTLLTPEQDEQLLREAGFADIAVFYVGFTFRGWVAYAP